MRIFLRLLMAAAMLYLCGTAVHAAAGKPHAVHFLHGGRILVSPGHTIEKGDLIIRDGRIEAVGTNLPRPADARSWDMSGKTIHAGFIDPYVTTSRLEGKPYKPKGRFVWDDSAVPDPDKPKEETPAIPASVTSSNPRVHPEWRVGDHLQVKPEAVEDLRNLGFVVAQAVPDQGILRGSAALYSLATAPAAEALLRVDSAAIIGFDTPLIDEGERSYPESMMGNVAFIRQIFSDAAWYRKAQQLESAAYHGQQRPPTDTTLAALEPVLGGTTPIFFESTTLLEALRANRLLDDLHLSRRVTVLSGEEWRRLDWLRAMAPSSGWVLPLAFPAAPKAKTEGDWLDLDLLTLQHWRNAPATPLWLSQDGIPFSFSTHRLESLQDFVPAIARCVDAGLPSERALESLTTQPARLLGIADRFGTLDAGKAASLVVRDGDFYDKNSKVCEVWIEGTRYPVLRVEDKKNAKKPTPPFSAADYKTRPTHPKALADGPVLVKDATVWTCGPQGTLQNADLLVSGGVVRAVGHNLSAPGALVIDGRGLHVTPGLIDAHSHTAIDGDVNEATHNVTAEVRIQDVINPFDLNVYRELAGGVTTANVLHGSANAIGGQVVTCKWKWGAAPQDMLMKGVPEGIKFALGENPKQSNWGDRYRSRYPQTRMGVAELIRERFVAARDYRKRQQEFAAGKIAMPPRTDYQLEALLEVLDGKRLIQCHSYRQDEILMLIRLAEEMGFKVKTFQHVLEGYKVADEIARHGAMASTFSDWWAYKYEVIDAIPYNGALMHDRGVVVSFNSDSDDLARRLNTEAAKAIRYGNLTEDEALKFETLNPARQLGVEQRLGSLEPGKDGDFVVWSDHPLSQRAVCLQTWVEGKKYFDRAADATEHAAEQAEWHELVQLAKKAKQDEK